MKAAPRFVYSLTCGPLGAAYLSELLRSHWSGLKMRPRRGKAWPEPQPGPGEMEIFNRSGNRRAVRRFWRQRFSADREHGGEVFCDCSPALGQAGLVENLDLLPKGAAVDLIVLGSDRLSALLAELEDQPAAVRGRSRRVTRSLQPAWGNAIIPAAPYEDLGGWGVALWRVDELMARQAYYGQWLDGRPGVSVRHTELKTIVTELGAWGFLRSLGLPAWEESLKLPKWARQVLSGSEDDSLRAEAASLVQALPCDPPALGAAFFEQGHRLAHPVHLEEGSIPTTVTACPPPAEWEGSEPDIGLAS